jgi:hypothetical protein
MPPNKKIKLKRPWQEIAQEAQAYRDATIAQLQPPLPQFPQNLPQNVFNPLREALSHEELYITEAAPEELLAMLASGDCTARAVTTAFLRRAGLIQKLVYQAWKSPPGQ